MRDLPGGQRPAERVRVPEQSVRLELVLTARAGAETETRGGLGVEPGAHQLGIGETGWQYRASQRVRRKR
ncbi:hypothetical protein D3C72_1348300 [compost metagenome]